MGTLKLTGAAGSSVNYKFVINGATWEGNVGPSGAQNRSATLKGTGQVLPVVYFNNVTAVPSVVPLTFQVNLGVQIAQGNFDPAAGTVSVAGDVINNWSATASVLTNSATDPNLWLGTLDVTTSVGSVILYKFVLNEGATWESGDNRAFTDADTNAQTLPLVFFNGVNGSVKAGCKPALRVTA